VIDTRKKFNAFVEAGFTKEQAEAILYLYKNEYLNTLTWYKKLVKAGFTEPQAEMITAIGFAVHFRDINMTHDEYMKEYYEDV
jgi:hypothetical protein